ncbi:unnamed protein product [Closterium sp. NIES-64]|nr:unnamed protein product [Closterium sp. NIES-64]
METSQPSLVAPPSLPQNSPLSPYLAALALSSPVLSVNDEDTNGEDRSTLLSPALASPAAPNFRCRFRTPLFGCVALDAVQREVRGRRELAERGALQAQGEGGRKQQEGKQTAAQEKRRLAQEKGKGTGINQQRLGAESAAEGEEALRISHDLAMFVGGPIWAVDWCPLPRYSHTQYLAVASHPHLRPFSPIGVPLCGPALVQVWAVRLAEGDGEAEGEGGGKGEGKGEGGVEGSLPWWMLASGRGRGRGGREGGGERGGERYGERSRKRERERERAREGEGVGVKRKSGDMGLGSRGWERVEWDGRERKVEMRWERGEGGDTGIGSGGRGGRGGEGERGEGGGGGRRERRRGRGEEQESRRASGADGAGDCTPRRTHSLCQVAAAGWRARQQGRSRRRGESWAPCELAWKVDSASHAASHAASPASSPAASPASSPATSCSPTSRHRPPAAGFQDGSVRNDPPHL